MEPTQAKMEINEAKKDKSEQNKAKQSETDRVKTKKLFQRLELCLVQCNQSCEFLFNQNSETTVAETLFGKTTKTSLLVSDSVKTSFGSSSGSSNTNRVL